MVREKLTYPLRVQLPESLGLALEATAENRMLSLSALVRVELAKSLGLIESSLVVAAAPDPEMSDQLT